MTDMFTPNTIIRNLQELNIDDYLHRFDDEKLKALAIENAKLISVYIFEYESNGRWIQGFVSLPKNATGKLACIIVNRGGTGDFGAIRKGTLFFEYYAWFTLAGYISIMTNYAGDDKMGSAQDTQDLLRLYDLLTLIPQADLNRIGMIGWSRGGQALYQSLREKPEWLKAGISIAGAADHIHEIEWRKITDWGAHLKEVFGGSKEDIIYRSALYWTDDMKKVPLLLIHGTEDDRVDHTDSIKLAEKLPNAKLILYPDGHMLKKHRDVIEKECIEWFNKYL